MSSTIEPLPSLTEHSLYTAVEALAAADADLARVVVAFGCPPLWGRAAGFPTLLHIVLEQQVSLASAQAAFARLVAAGPVTPEKFLTFSDVELRTFGFSRQKAGYVRGLAQAVTSGALELAALQHLDDDAAHQILVSLKGIGPWTADIYLLMALCRPDIWPTGDIALVQALQEVKSLPQRPSAGEALAIAEGWRPWRAAAARLLWHWYLSTPRRRLATTKGKRESEAALSSPVTPAVPLPEDGA